MDESALRQLLIDTARGSVRLGLNRGTCGNVSARLPGGFLITPTGIAYDALEPADLVRLDGHGVAAPGQLKPSSEWRFHRDIYAARPDIAAIVHTHSRYASALACQRRDLPAFHYMVAAAGGDNVRCAQYATFGSAELSANALLALDGRHACLLANHGLIATGASLPAALDLAEEIESLAAQYCAALASGTPVLLDAAEMARVLEQFKTYGKQDTS
ncbi:class II aldolase/adducin family protein [Immundisolibacter sp.]|uniref:class II aldolase/adducin family protein n=1 Tax=Immundisolibacter sp. TaxID=1934948 RepID=UPI002635B11C|nr:class II aldolase/adducin family protein [Immundisolibacter sp.]MDD3651257.1 class II aldolase/adducin family protein [Immundisolibacter sp.]